MFLSLLCLTNVFPRLRNTLLHNDVSSDNRPPLRGVYTLRALVTSGAWSIFIIDIVVFRRRQRDVEGRGKYKREDPMVMCWQKKRRDVPTRSGILKSVVRDTKQ